ncbi:AAA family ATPase [Bacillus safensis]
MKIEIENLGQVKNALIEEEPNLTVIVGDNGSGKTLLLEAKTFILQSYSNHSQRIQKDLTEKYMHDLEFLADWKTVKEFINQYSNYNHEPGEERPSLTFSINCNINKAVNEKINIYIKDQFDDLQKIIIRELNKEILMVDESEVNFKVFGIPHIPEISDITCVIKPGETELFILDISIKGYEEYAVTTAFVTSRHSFVLDEYTDFDINEKNQVYDPIEDLLSRIKQIYFYVFFKELRIKSNILYLPSERNLFMDDALTKTIKESFDSRHSFSRMNTKVRYSEHLFNISYLKYKDRLSRLTPEFQAKLVDRQLAEMFGGKITFDEEGDIKSIRKNDNEIIKRELFSTKQNRLIPYLLINGNSIMGGYQNVIIEEPESHLSLKSIRELINYLKILIRRGVKITITTHSDVFFSHLNNLILENKQFDTKVYELKYSNDVSYLEEKQITEQGYEIDLFTQELEELFEKTLEIQDKTELEEE